MSQEELVRKGAKLATTGAVLLTSAGIAGLNGMSDATTGSLAIIGILSEDKEFNAKWHLVSANRKNWQGSTYQRGTEPLSTRNAAAWYESAVYWRDEYERLQRDVEHIEKQYLKEHGHWGNCPHRLKLEQIKDLLK